jgi:hypothetical protein
LNYEDWGKGKGKGEGKRKGESKVSNQEFLLQNFVTVVLLIAIVLI